MVCSPVKNVSDSFLAEATADGSTDCHHLQHYCCTSLGSVQHSVRIPFPFSVENNWASRKSNEELQKQLHGSKHETK